MSSTTFLRGGTHTNLVPQIWSKADFKAAFEANPFFKYMGVGDTNLVQVKQELLKEKGDKITFALRALLTGSGQGDDGEYEGNEEAMVFYDDSIQIYERGHSVLLSGNKTEQSAYADLREKGRSAIQEWTGRVIARGIVDALSGLTTKSFAGQITGANAVDYTSTALSVVNQTAVSKSATATRWFGGGQTTAGVLSRVATDALITDASSAHRFGTLVISHVKRMATKTINSSTGAAVTPIRPIVVNGKKYFLMFADPWQIKDLRKETAWLQAQREANVRGSENPIFSGAEGIWDGVVLHESELLHRRTGAGGITAPEYFDSTSDACYSGTTVARGLFCGAQSVGLAWGKKPTWTDGYKDWQKTKWGTHTNMLMGFKKFQFNSEDFGCIVVDTAINETD